MTESESELARQEREAIMAESCGSDLVAAALTYAALGWDVFPISRARTPLAGSHGYKDASRDPARLGALFSQPGSHGLAVATESSGLVVLDIDPRNGGEATAARVLGGALPPHPIKRTPRGGVHRLLRSPVLSKIQTKANALGAGVDVEAAGAGVMFSTPTPGYSWDVSPWELSAPHLPLWLWKLLPKVEQSRRPRGPRGTRTVPFSLGDALEALGRIGRRRRSSGGWLTLCPGHSDRHQSLSIREGADGQPLFHCFAGCSFREIVAALEGLAGQKGAA